MEAYLMSVQRDDAGERRRLPFVHVFQPVIPHYRLPVFDALCERLGGRLKVSASPQAFQCPDSVSAGRPYFDLDHPCSSLERVHLYWQHRLAIAPEVGRGDVVIVSGNPRFLSTLPLAYRARASGAGLIIWTQVWSPTSVPWRARIRLQMIRVADALLVYTESEERLIRPYLPSGMPIYAAGNAIDLSPIAAAREDYRSASISGKSGRRKRRNEPLLLFVGRLRSHPPSELDVAIRALVSVRNRSGRNVRLAVIGDGGERTRLEKLARDLQVDGQVFWLGEILDERELAAWFCEATAFVYPGSIGLGLMHAMAYGLPAITHSDFRRHAPEIEALVPGVNGLVFERGNSEELADRVLELLADEPCRRKLGAAAQATVEEKYTLSAMVDRVSRAIEAASLVSLRRAGV